MEFKFSVNEVFRQPIVKIGSNLVPPGFTGDRRAFWDIVGKVSEVVNAMGEASAAAQGLTKPITTSDRLRNSEHSVYFLIDQNANNGRGAITGMLKTGKKGLYVFDRNGQHYQVSPPCVLDFYIHESRQRTGLGKRLFEHMLQDEAIEPVKMAIDRPSEKFLGFLNKHYSLNSPVKQMNNYVVFDGFFPSSPEKNCPVELDHSGSTPGKKQSANGLQTTSFTPLGRYGAPRPPCSMGQIIHNQSSTIPKNPEPTGVGAIRSAPETNYQNAAINSPGIPSNVTQSTPNIYYRSHEPQTKLNGLPEITNFQMAQQNSMWQDYGNTGIVDPKNVSYQNPAYYNQQSSQFANQPQNVDVVQQQNMVPDQGYPWQNYKNTGNTANNANQQTNMYYSQQNAQLTNQPQNVDTNQQQFIQSQLAQNLPQSYQQATSSAVDNPNQIHQANLRQNQSMVQNTYNTPSQESYVPQLTQAPVPPRPMQTNPVQYGTQEMQPVQYKQAVQPNNQMLSIMQPDTQLLSAEPRSMVLQSQVTPTASYQQQIRAGPAQNVISQAQVSPNVTPSNPVFAQNTTESVPVLAQQTSYVPESTQQTPPPQFPPVENLNQSRPQSVQNTQIPLQQEPSAYRGINAYNNLPVQQSTAALPTPQYLVNNPQMTAATNVNMQYPAAYTQSMINANVDTQNSQNQINSTTNQVAHPNPAMGASNATHVVPQYQTQNVYKTSSQPNAVYASSSNDRNVYQQPMGARNVASGTTNDQMHMQNMQYQSQAQTPPDQNTAQFSQHPEGTQYNKSNVANEPAPDQREKGDAFDENLIIQYGYPPQVRNSLHQAISGNVVGVTGP